MRREYSLKRLYGITDADFTRMSNEQGRRCAICRVRIATDVDHDHKTGKVRGLLCGSCNRALGLMKDTPHRLEAAAKYLRKHTRRLDDENRTAHR
jgi:hypothetical protein